MNHHVSPVERATCAGNDIGLIAFHVDLENIHRAIAEAQIAKGGVEIELRDYPKTPSIILQQRVAAEIGALVAIETSRARPMC